jgi:hypothetical protein
MYESYSDWTFVAVSMLMWEMTAEKALVIWLAAIYINYNYCIIIFVQDNFPSAHMKYLNELEAHKN